MVLAADRRNRSSMQLRRCESGIWRLKPARNLV